MTENNEDTIISNLEILQDDIRKIEKQFQIKQDLDQLKRNIHKLHDKSSKLELKNLLTKPKLINLVKNNKLNKELFVEHHGENKFKFKSVKKQKKKKVEISAD
tara:strand:+ start:3244 stop:3552 length:309 start_codon:yes stop_codon:yes gene_type:complete